MNNKRVLVVLAALLFMLPMVWADNLAVDRGLPGSNLNNAALSDRSNVDWASNDPAVFLGDDFTISGSGLTTISTIRVWFDECTPPSTTCDLSQYYQSVSLYGGSPGSNLSLKETATFTGGSGVDNPNVTVTATQYPSSVPPETAYQAGSSGDYYQLWELDFTNLNWVVPAGQLIQFGVLGLGGGPSADMFYLEASNAGKGGVPADGADGLYSGFSTTDFSYLGSYDSATDTTWDKGSDIDVQVFTTPEPSAWFLLATMAGGLALMRRRRA